MITAELLTRVPLFAQIPETERASLAARAADVRVRADEWLILEGQTPAFYALIDGRIEVLKSVAGQDRHVTFYEPGTYFGEVPILLGAPTIASLRATEPSRLMRLDPTDFHELISHCHVLNERIMATMAQRVAAVQQLVIDTSPIRAYIVGRHNDPDCHELREFLQRNRLTYKWLDPDVADDVSEIAELGVHPGPDGEYPCPILVTPERARVDTPSYRQAAELLGLQTVPRHATYDVVIVGGGAAGLAAGVYGASEGLRTLLVEKVAFGGQAGTSSRIENYLGFPAGLTGDDLSGRAYAQASRFGAELLAARCATAIEPGDASSGAPHRIVLDDATRLDTKAIVLANGVQWRHLGVPGVDRLIGKGVFYGASRTEALGMSGRRVHLVGGGNSAGQAAMAFSNYAESVTMLVRGPSLAASMSSYLIDQLASKSNITIETETSVVGVIGESALEGLELEVGPGRRRETRASDGLFILIGAHAETGWLPDAVIRDQWDYVCTGRDVMDLLRDQTTRLWPRERDPFLLETSVPGIFAAGDVRHGSIKRCASAVGEGSMAIAFVHQYLAEDLHGTVA